jgi:hypothetical protein
MMLVSVYFLELRLDGCQPVANQLKRQVACVAALQPSGLPEPVFVILWNANAERIIPDKRSWLFDSAHNAIKEYIVTHCKTNRDKKSHLVTLQRRK